MGVRVGPWGHGQDRGGVAEGRRVQPWPWGCSHGPWERGQTREGMARGRGGSGRGRGGAAKAVWEHTRTWLRLWGHCQGAVKTVGAELGAVRARPRRLGHSQGVCGHG